MPSYAQAITSQYASVFFDGDVEPASLDTGYGRTNFLRWGGAPNRPVVVRKSANSTRWVIAGAIMRNSNDVDNSLAEAASDVMLPTSAVGRVRLNVRVQGSVYLYDETNPTAPTLTQLDAWHEATHPSYWSSNLVVEAELGSRTALGLHASALGARTEVPAAALPGDFTSFRTFVVVAGDPLLIDVPLNTPTIATKTLQVCLLFRRETGPSDAQLHVALHVGPVRSGIAGRLGTVTTASPKGPWQWMRVAMQMPSNPHEFPAPEQLSLLVSASSPVDLDKVALLMYPRAEDCPAA